MASISIRVSNSDKTMFEDFCEGVGMNITTACNMFIKNVIKNQRIPFDVELEEIKDYKNTYPKDFFKYFGCGKDLGLDEEPKDTPWELDSKREDM